MDPKEQIKRACRDFLAPLVKADGGELWLVSIGTDEVHIHLAGTCAGCPGASLTTERLVEPAILAIAPRAQVRVTTGWRVPDGATKID